MPTARRAANPRRRSRPRSERRTGSNPAFVRAVAAALPGAEVHLDGGRATASVDGSAFLAVEDDGAVEISHASEGGRVLVAHEVPRDELRRSIEEAWCSFAPKRRVTAFRRAQAAWEEQPPVTADDIRRVVLSLPGAAEGPIWGSDLGFLIGSEKRTRFARFGPPIGSTISGLQAPDDEDTLVVLRCDRRPALLASRPERYFSTSHYGAPDEPGGVITRLSEHRGAADLEELADLLEDAWREVAPASLVAELERR